MSKESLVLWILGICVFLLLVAFIFAMFFLKNPKKKTENEKRMKAKDLLILAKKADNSLDKLSEYVEIAKQDYGEFMRENENFDVEFLMILTAHKNINAPLLLGLEKFFKNQSPSRAPFLEKALGEALGKR